jgi:hypothetical protein
MPVILAFETVMVEPAIAEVGTMFPLEACMIVRIVGVITIVAMPGGIAIVGVTGIISFKVDAYMNLGAGRLNGERTGYDQRKGKKFRFHKITFKS